MRGRGGNVVCYFNVQPSCYSAYGRNEKIIERKIPCEICHELVGEGIIMLTNGGSDIVPQV